MFYQEMMTDLIKCNANQVTLVCKLDNSLLSLRSQALWFVSHISSFSGSGLVSVYDYTLFRECCCELDSRVIAIHGVHTRVYYIPSVILA